LDALCVKKEELATYGIIIENKDYHSTIITSLPHHLSNFASSLLAGARLYSTTKTINPDELIGLISEEFEHGVASRSWRSNARASKRDDKDEAILATLSGKGKCFECKPHEVCWNCGDKGHFKDKCPKLVKDKKDDSPKRGSSVNAAIESDSEGKGAFFAELWDSDSELQTAHNLDLELKGDSNGDWFSEVGNDSDNSWDTEELFGTDGSECGSLVSVDPNSVAINLDDAAAHVEPDSKAGSSPRVEVYDSGCMRHITPY
jgi:hypothetical protein